MPDWKVCFLRAEDIFSRQICALEKPPSQHPYICTGIFFKGYSPNFAHLSGRCAHSSLLARGRSSAHITNFQSGVYALGSAHHRHDV